MAHVRATLELTHSAVFTMLGAVTGLPGGMPIVVDGQCVGGVGIGSGSGEQDIAVATAALGAIGATQR